MLLLYLTFIMIVIHALGVSLSFSKRTFPKFIGNLIAVYEMIFYFMIIFSTIIYKNKIILVISYIYLIIHLIGGIAYLKGYLSKLYSAERLKYYGFYELIEMLYLISILFEI
ncbi:conserved hypothetical protein [Sulfolobus islandicus REY15A]|uniref:Uncharacterized protein n=1 Tax=Saccharolobus islandicus (strain REY15A) TaxID=930945 RepID=F0NGF5_SACI5|nr:conserved hypothetical protein [Sulfolobus islandicus REY15A]